MRKLELWYAVKPNLGVPLDMTGKIRGHGINQLFGENPEYYAKFGDKGHPGIDFTAPHATPLYAPCDGQAFYAQDAHGGDGIYIRTQADKEYTVILWHLCSKDDPKYHPLIPTDGSLTTVKVGQLIGYTDNTGAPYESSGDHLHFGLYPCYPEGLPLDPENGFHGCINPKPYFNGYFAQDHDAVMNNLTQQVSIGRKLVQLFQQLLQKVKGR